MMCRCDIKKTVESMSSVPHLYHIMEEYIITRICFLANEDPAAVSYAQWTERSCLKVGIKFSLRRVDKLDLEESIIQANNDKDVSGIMVYYPVFSGDQVR